MTVIEVPHLHNLREIGGLPLTGSRRVRSGLVYRSAAPLRDSNAVVPGVRDLGVQRVLDLRDEGERRMAPSLWEGSDLEVLHVPVFGGHLRTLRFPDLTTLYEIMIRDHGEALTQAVGAIAQTPDRPTLVHCTAGKDRTGVVIGLLLELLGADRATVLKDFTRSEQLLGPAYLADLFEGIDIEQLPGGAAHRAVSSPRALLEGALEQITAQHGGAEGFVLAHGLEQGDVDRLRAALVEAV